MAAAISAINAKLRSHPVLNYVCSTRMFYALLPSFTWLIMELLDFWGPVSNFGIPVAAVIDTQKDPDMYDFSLLVLLLSRPIRIPF